MRLDIDRHTQVNQGETNKERFLIKNNADKIDGKNRFQILSEITLNYEKINDKNVTKEQNFIIHLATLFSGNFKILGVDSFIIWFKIITSCYCRCLAIGICSKLCLVYLSLNEPVG